MQIGQLYNVHRKDGGDILIYKDRFSPSHRIPNNSTLMIYMSTSIDGVYTVCIQEYGVCFLNGNYVFLKVT